MRAVVANSSSQSGPTSLAEAGGHPSNGFKKISPSTLSKRKSTDDGDDDDSSPKQKGQRDGPKKKKANRACFHCQKSHLTCDNTRPCQRCVKRGIADSCVEGHRKKAKYLLDDAELVELKNTKPASNGSSNPKSLPVQLQAATAQDMAPLPTSEPFLPNDPLFNVSFDPSFPFDSEHAHLEYSMLSAILGGPGSPDAAMEPSLDPPVRQTELHAHEDTEGLDTRGHEGSPEPYMQMLIDPPTWPADSLNGTFGLSDQYDMLGGMADGYSRRPYGLDDLSVPPSDLSPSNAGGLLISDFMTLQYSPQQQRLQHQSLVSTSGPDSDPLLASNIDASPKIRKPSIYERVTVAYDYTEGYHALMKHLSSRFDKNDILRVVRALAIFRPSLIALQMPLSQEDEVFLEKCFQRSLVELDKLISFSGTPTVAWRRTGEICLVGAEFCMLTEWTKEELVSQRKYVWELFENQSVVEYWENFASHAFENTTQSVYSHCVLLKPSGLPVPCTFCFSIRRDMFDLPSLVIGQWLPLL